MTGLAMDVAGDDDFWIEIEGTPDFRPVLAGKPFEDVAYANEVWRCGLCVWRWTARRKRPGRVLVFIKTDTRGSPGILVIQGLSRGMCLC